MRAKFEVAAVTQARRVTADDSRGDRGGRWELAAAPAPKVEARGTTTRQLAKQAKAMDMVLGNPSKNKQRSVLF